MRKSQTRQQAKVCGICTGKIQSLGPTAFIARENVTDGRLKGNILSRAPTSVSFANKWEGENEKERLKTKAAEMVRKVSTVAGLFQS